MFQLPRTPSKHLWEANGYVCWTKQKGNKNMNWVKSTISLMCMWFNRYTQGTEKVKVKVKYCTPVKRRHWPFLDHSFLISELGDYCLDDGGGGRSSVGMSPHWPLGPCLIISGPITNPQSPAPTILSHSGTKTVSLVLPCVTDTRLKHLDLNSLLSVFVTWKHCIQMVHRPTPQLSGSTRDTEDLDPSPVATWRNSV